MFLDSLLIFAAGYEMGDSNNNGGNQKNINKRSKQVKSQTAAP
jgi:hypothetical protein